MLFVFVCAFLHWRVLRVFHSRRNEISPTPKDDGSGVGLHLVPLAVERGLVQRLRVPDLPLLVGGDENVEAEGVVHDDASVLSQPGHADGEEDSDSDISDSVASPEISDDSDDRCRNPIHSCSW